MAIAQVIAQIDAEILKLQNARALLSQGVEAKKPGRPKGSKNAAKTASSAPQKAKRTLTPEGRKAIADAMKRRWAEKRKQNSR